MKIGIIFACTHDGGIGLDGSMPWHIPEDLTQFRAATMGCPMIMGRKTWDSFNGRVLPGRPHIVVTRNPDFVLPDDPNVHVANCYEHAKRLALTLPGSTIDGMAWVIGGAGLIEEAVKDACIIRVSHIDKETYSGPTDVKIRRNVLDRIYANRMRVEMFPRPSFTLAIYQMA